jgi:hypothetical protein
MRRALASLLLVLFSFALASPAFAADPDSNLPACCRRGGKHECSMHNSGQPGWQSAQCPIYPGARGTAAQPFSATLATVTHSTIVLLLACWVIAWQAFVLVRNFDRASWKRGPPTLLA